MLRLVDRDNDNRKNPNVPKENNKVPAAERIEYRNAIWLLENETDGTYASFGERIGRSRQEVNRFLRPDPTYGISRRMAMRIEKGFNKPDGWLSQDHGFPAPRGNSETAEPEQNYRADKRPEWIRDKLAFTSPRHALNDEYHMGRIRNSERTADWLAMRLIKQTGINSIRVSPVFPHDVSSPILRALCALTPIYRLDLGGETLYFNVERYTLPGMDEPKPAQALASELLGRSLSEETRLGTQDGWLSVYVLDRPEEKSTPVISVTPRFTLSGMLLVEAEEEGKIQSRDDMIDFLKRTTQQTLS